MTLFYGNDIKRVCGVFAFCTTAAMGKRAKRRRAAANQTRRRAPRKTRSRGASYSLRRWICLRRVDQQKTCSQHVSHRGISWPQFRKTERRTARLKARCAASRSPASSARYAAHLRSIIFSGRSAMTFGKPPKAKLKKLTANRTNQPGRAPVRGSSLRTRGCPACIHQSSTPLSVHWRLRDLAVSIVL